MKKNYIFTLLLTIVISTVTFGQNLATNGGFESWTTGVPDSWPTIDFNTTDLTQDMTTFSEGASSAKVVLITQSQGSTDIRQSVTLSNGAVYKVSLDVYATDNQARARVFGPSYSPSVYSDETLLNQWQTITFDYTASADEDVEFGIRFYDTSANWTGAGSIFYIDNFQIVEKLTPSVTITSPTNNKRYASSTTTVSVEVGVNNFTFSGDGGSGTSDGSGDGFIKRTLVAPSGTSSENVFNADPANISVSDGESFSVTIELVDNSGASFAPAISETVAFSVDNPPSSLPVSDDFTYSNGSLIDSPLWVSNGGIRGDLMVTSGQALVQHGTPSEDANLEFIPVAGNVYYALDFTVMDPGSPISGTDTEYFAHFKDAGFGFRARLDIVSPSATGDFSVGISSIGSTADATWATDLLYGTTYRATVKYDQDNNIAQLWIDAAVEGDTSILGTDEVDPGDSMVAFGLRQSDSELNEGVLVDNLRIATTFSATTLSIERNNSIQGFAAYPNPITNNIFTITSNSNSKKELTIFNVLGKRVLSSSFYGVKSDVNVSTISSGIYILKVTEDGKTSTKKLVIK